MELNNKEIAYLLGCYVIVEDKEINSHELAVLNNFLPLQKDSQLYEERKKIFQDDETKIPVKKLLDELSHLHLNKEENEDLVHFLVRISYADFIWTQRKEILRKRYPKFLMYPLILLPNMKL